MTDHQLCIRIKRRNQTFCFICDPSDTILSIKEKMIESNNQFNINNDDDHNITTDTIRLLLPFDQSILLNDNDIISTYEDVLLKNNKNDNNNVILYAIYKVSDNEYESIDIVPIDVFDSESTTKVNDSPS